LLETLKMIAAQVRHPDQREAILRQANMIKRASNEALPEKYDREDVEKRYQALRAVLNEPGLSDNTHTFPKK
jgi:uncharacterized membrane protein